jgi:hypothetical protein
MSYGSLVVDTMRQRFRRHAMIWSQFKHPNIHEMQGAFLDDEGQLNLIAPYVNLYGLVEHVIGVEYDPHHGCMPLVSSHDR